MNNETAVSTARQAEDDVLLILPVRNLVLFPGVVMPLTVGRKGSIEAAQEARSLYEIPSVIVSAHDDSDVRQRAAQARPLGWITKPVLASRIPELLRLLARPLN